MQSIGIMGGTGDNNFSPTIDFTIQQSIVTILRLYDFLTANELPNVGRPPIDMSNELTGLDDSQGMPTPVGLTMNISSYTASGLTFYFENLTDRAFTFGEDFALYKFVNNTWERVEPIIDGHAVISIGHCILPNSTTNERTYAWAWLFGELPSGEYRFQKEVLYIRQPGDFDRFVLESEFTLP